MAPQDDPRDTQLADPNWFRAPSRRERWLAAAMFVGFGVFFALLFVVNRGWWFRWIILLLAVASVWNAVRHFLHAGKSES